MAQKIIDLVKEESLTAEKLQNLIAEGADINEIEEDGASPLLAACAANNLRFAKILLEEAADVNNELADTAEPSGYGIATPPQKPITLAVNHNNPDMISLLLEYGADLNVAPMAIANAYKKHDIQLTTQLLKHKVAFNNRMRKFMKKSPENYNENYVAFIMTDEKWEDNHTAEDLLAILNKKISEDDALKNSSEIANLVKTIKYKDFSYDFSGWNSDDKIDKPV